MERVTVGQYHHVSVEVLEERYALARKVSSFLESLGFPSSVREGHESSPGAVVAVDSGDYDSGGVFVTWNAGSDLEFRAARAVEIENFSDPAIELAGKTAGMMADTLLRLLQLAGYSAEMDDYDMRPFAVRVVAVPEVPLS
jgi:hypothetical protein